MYEEAAIAGETDNMNRIDDEVDGDGENGWYDWKNGDDRNVDLEYEEAFEYGYGEEEDKTIKIKTKVWSKGSLVQPEEQVFQLCPGCATVSSVDRRLA